MEAINLITDDDCITSIQKWALDQGIEYLEPTTMESARNIACIILMNHPIFPTNAVEVYYCTKWFSLNIENSEKLVLLLKPKAKTGDLRSILILFFLFNWFPDTRNMACMLGKRMLEMGYTEAPLLLARMFSTSIERFAQGKKLYDIGMRTSIELKNCPGFINSLTDYYANMDENHMRWTREVTSTEKI